MSLIYCMIARTDQIILSEYQLVSGNFPQVLLPLLMKLEPNVKDSFDYNKDFSIHYLNEREVTFLCLADIGFSKILAYGFLEELSKEFFVVFQENEIKQSLQYALNNSFYDKIHGLIGKFNGNLSKENRTELKRIYNKIDDHNECITRLLNKEEMVELTVYKPMQDSLFSKEVLAENSREKFKKVLKSVCQWILLLSIFSLIGYLTLTTICKGYLIPECLGYYDNF